LNLEPGSILRKFLRLVRAISPLLARPDDVWAQQKLPETEFGLFQKMDPRDREHAVRVAQKLLVHHPNASDEAVRAALLHDCGKQVRPYRFLERVIVGLIAPEGPRSIQPANFPVLQAALQVRNTHPAIGAKLILEAGGNPRVAELVGKHHHPGNDLEAIWIHELDDAE
jgi:HD domain